MVRNASLRSASVRSPGVGIGMIKNPELVVGAATLAGVMTALLASALALLA